MVTVDNKVRNKADKVEYKVRNKADKVKYRVRDNGHGRIQSEGQG